MHAQFETRKLMLACNRIDTDTGLRQPVSDDIYGFVVGPAARVSAEHDPWLWGALLRWASAQLPDDAHVAQSSLLMFSVACANSSHPASPEM